jgi:hypothetical protein
VAFRARTKGARLLDQLGEGDEPHLLGQRVGAERLAVQELEQLEQFQRRGRAQRGDEPLDLFARLPGSALE